MNEAAIDAALLAYCKATGLNPEHGAVLREALRQSVSAYLTVDRNKYPEAPLGSPVRYTDGSTSREYDEQPNKHPAIIQGEKTMQEMYEAMGPRTENSTGAHQTKTTEDK